MRANSIVRNIVLIWIGWALVILAFQHWIGARLDLSGPDKVLFWTAAETTAGSQDDKPYLNDQFLNEQVAWDSEFYLSIATLGYDDLAVRGIPSDFAWGFRQQFCRPGAEVECTSLSYAFFPLYPWLTRIVTFPLRVLPLTSIAHSTLAAVIVSLLGALGAMLALYFMARDSLGEEGGLRAAFYLLIFPSGFFMAQVYPEGLFLGLTFGALAFLLARKWGWSALLAALAVWTRPGGALLLLPMAMVWVKDKAWQGNWKSVIRSGLAALSPALSFGVWSLTPFAKNFYLVEALFFGRGLLAVKQSLDAWKGALMLFSSGNMQSRVYYSLEFAAILLALVTCILLFKQQPEISLFGLAMIVFAFTSGAAQGMLRYVLTSPALFWMLAKWGKQPAFDRVWSIACILVMGMGAILFSFNFWVA